MKVRPGQNARPLPGEGKVKSSPCRHLPILTEGKRTDSVRLLLDAARRKDDVRVACIGAAHLPRNGDNVWLRR